MKIPDTFQLRLVSTGIGLLVGRHALVFKLSNSQTPQTLSAAIADAPTASPIRIRKRKRHRLFTCAFFKNLTC